jgi:AraC-like DNA-binding protein
MKDCSTKTRSSANHNASKPARTPRPPVFNEASVWQSISNGWRQLYGGFYESGVSIEWHDFALRSPFDWARSFHPQSLELCLNFSGQGWVRSETTRMEFEPLTAGFFLPGKDGLQAGRNAGEQPHRFVSVEFSARFLREKLSACDGALHPLIERFVRGDTSQAEAGDIHQLTAEQERLLSQLPSPPVAQAARALWYESKVLELMTAFFFERKGESELFCDRQKRIARERVDSVLAILREHLSAPPNLHEIGRLAGCSPFHLSRTFSAVTGMTIPQYLRKMRMEKAAELLRSGRYNVTEAAMEVGYSSLSHFSQAFCQTMGCCPMLYPLAGTAAASASGKSKQKNGKPA